MTLGLKGLITTGTFIMGGLMKSDLHSCDEKFHLFRVLRLLLLVLFVPVHGPFQNVLVCCEFFFFIEGMKRERLADAKKLI